MNNEIYKNEFGDYKKLINEELFDFLKNEKNNINEPFFSYIQEYVFSGGKRLRPLALIFTYMQFKKFEKKILMPAIAIELHHTYSLILDDVMDEDEFRRNKPTIYKKTKDYYLKNFKDENYNGSLFNKKSNRFSVSFAIMLGNLTNILSKQAILKSDFSDEIKLKAINILEETDKQIYQGQMLDVLFENMNYLDINEENYIEMIKLKTGVLFGTCFELGALFANKIDFMNDLKELGINAAIAFQINDDILDLLDEEKKGHELGSDLKKQKKTLILIMTLQYLNKINEKDKIKFLLSLNPNSRNNEIKKAIEIINKANSINYALVKKKYYLKKSENILKKLKLTNMLNFLGFMLN